MWRGSAFQCPNKVNEIILRHSQFAPGQASGFCGDGVVRITGVGFENVTNDQFISQVNVTTYADLNGRTIECAHDNGVTTVTIGVATVTVLAGTN